MLPLKHFLKPDPYGFKMLLHNSKHQPPQMRNVEVIVVKTARPSVYTVSAGWQGDRRRQICHRILKFAFYKCIQKVTVLLLCRSLPHLNLIITALCKIWDSQGLVGWRSDVASCLCSWLDSWTSIAQNFGETVSSYSSVCLSHPQVWLVFRDVVILIPVSEI